MQPRKERNQQDGMLTKTGENTDSVYTRNDLLEAW